jgi:hypothetical protein
MHISRHSITLITVSSHNTDGQSRYMLGERCYVYQGEVSTTACGDEVNNPNRMNVD